MLKVWDAALNRLLKRKNINTRKGKNTGKIKNNALLVITGFFILPDRIDTKETIPSINRKAEAMLMKIQTGKTKYSTNKEYWKLWTLLKKMNELASNKKNIFKQKEMLKNIFLPLLVSK